MPPFAPTSLLLPESGIGSIIIWQGSIESLPSSWTLCDGTQGSPDLRNRFLYGNSVGTPPTVTGGTVNHDHDFNSDGHTHDLDEAEEVNSASGRNKTVTTESFGGLSDNSDHLPKYYSLAYIMFIGGD